MISIIIPTYKRFDYLKKAIQSVINQNYNNIEIIVINDHSEDETRKIKEVFPQIVYIENVSNKGPGYSRKIGLNYSTGDYIVFLDDDDYYTDYTFFNLAIDHLEHNPECVFVSANADELYVSTGKIKENHLNVIGELSSVEYLRGFVSEYNKPLSTFTTVFRKSSLIESGVLKMNMVNDMSIFLRVLRNGNVFFLKNSVGIYRIHNENISKHIKLDFLIDNLKEKKEVYRYIKSNRLFDQYDLWWVFQIKTTVSYYVYGTIPKLHEMNKLYKWCCENSANKLEIKIMFRNYYNYLIDYRVCTFKRRIKKFLRCS